MKMLPLSKLILPLKYFCINIKIFHLKQGSKNLLNIARYFSYYVSRLMSNSFIESWDYPGQSSSSAVWTPQRKNISKLILDSQPGTFINNKP